jgi:hypothetical protein
MGLSCQNQVIPKNQEREKSRFLLIALLSCVGGFLLMLIVFVLLYTFCQRQRSVRKLNLKVVPSDPDAVKAKQTEREL